MPAFTHIHWHHPDVWAILVGRGVGTLEANVESACETWLERAGYTVLELDFANGISPVISKLAQWLHWEQQFGYQLDPESRNLDALRDGFEFEDENLVLKLAHFEQAWSENVAWSRGFLSIVSEQSIRQLALGKRFFAILPFVAPSFLIGQCFEELCLSSPFRFPGPVA